MDSKTFKVLALVITRLEVTNDRSRLLKRRSARPLISLMIAVYVTLKSTKISEGSWAINNAARESLVRGIFVQLCMPYKGQCSAQLGVAKLASKHCYAIVNLFSAIHQ